MIAIKYKRLKASFGVKRFEWTSDNKRFAKILNDYRPGEGDLSAGTSYMIGPRGIRGVDGVALKKVIGFLGFSVKVIEYEPIPIPEEKEGVVI